MRFDETLNLQSIASGLAAVAPTPNFVPDLSIVVPVNAQGDLQNVLRLASDVARYRGPATLELILVINNYPAESPPREIESFRELGIRVIAVPDVRRPGEAIGFSARIPGVRAARSEYVILLDADCRVRNITALLGWYLDALRGAHAAYTPVAYYDFADAVSVRLRFLIHHSARWLKRNLLRIPTTRGSNYAVRRSIMLELYQARVLADEMNVGPAFKRLKGRVAYGAGRELTVYTSGRMFRPGWRRILPYFTYRLRYNLRVLPVRVGVAGVTGRENDSVRRYVENKPIRDE